jgi:hypothetical protein
MKRFSAIIALSALMLSPLGNAATALPLINNNFDLDHSGASIFTSSTSARSSALSGRAADIGVIDYAKDYSRAPHGGFHNVSISGLFSNGSSDAFRTIIGNEYAVNFDIPDNLDRRSAGENTKPYLTGLHGIVVASSIPFGTREMSRPDMGWMASTYTLCAFIADPGTASFHFFIKERGPSGSGTDDGSLSAVPLPSALPLLATGLAAFGIVARRRRKL